MPEERRETVTVHYTQLLSNYSMKVYNIVSDAAFLHSVSKKLMNKCLLTYNLQ